MELNWTGWSGAAAYWIYGTDNMPYFTPELASPYEYRIAVHAPGTTSDAFANGVGTVDHNWTYLLVCVDSDGEEMVRSNRIGEFDFTLP